MSYKQNIVVSNGPVQLVDKSRFGNSVSQGGVTCTNNGDGSWTINGNVTAENRFNLNFYQLGANVIPYWLSYMVPVEHNYYTQDCGYDKLGGWLFYYLEEGKNYENFKIYPQIISLTATFGSGNEPKNKEQVKAKFPDNLYPYNPTNRVTTYKELIKVSDVYQLVNKKRYPAAETKNGVTFTNNEDGTVTLNGTATAWAPFLASVKFDVFLGHKYLLYPNPTDVNVSLQLGFRNAAGVWLAQWLCNSPTVFTLTDKNAATGQFWVGVEEGKTVSNAIVTPQAFDLTEMYGSGNEPKTVAEFRAKFPNTYYPYSPNCWITSYKNISKVGEVCQLVDKTKIPASETVDGVAFTNNGDGTITVNGTSTAATSSFYISTKKFYKVGHWYALTGCPKGGASAKYTLQISFFGADTGDGMIRQMPERATDTDVAIYTWKDVVMDNAVYKPQLYDLTEMYGEGKEPKTMAEFRAKFPNEMYDYNLCCTV